MLWCWQTKPTDRPTFTQLQEYFAAMLQRDSGHDYFSFEVNEQRDYYQINSDEIAENIVEGVETVVHASDKVNSNSDKANSKSDKLNSKLDQVNSKSDKENTKVNVDALETENKLDSWYNHTAVSKVPNTSWETDQRSLDRKEERCIPVSVLNEITKAFTQEHITEDDTYDVGGIQVPSQAQTEQEFEHSEYQQNGIVNPVAHRIAKTLWSFGNSEGNRFNVQHELEDRTSEVSDSSLSSAGHRRPVSELDRLSGSSDEVFTDCPGCLKTIDNGHRVLACPQCQKARIELTMFDLHFTDRNDSAISSATSDDLKSDLGSPSGSPESSPSLTIGSQTATQVTAGKRNVKKTSSAKYYDEASIAEMISKYPLWTARDGNTSPKDNRIYQRISEVDANCENKTGNHQLDPYHSVHIGIDRKELWSVSETRM